MKKGMLFFLVLIFTTANIFATTYTQRVNITAGSGTQEMEFDYYDENSEYTLTNVNVKLYTTVSGGDNAADNDDDNNSVDVTIHLGAEFDLQDRFNAWSNPDVPVLVTSEGQNIWNNATETTWDDTLEPDNGDDSTFDSTAPDGVKHDGLDVTDTKVGDIHSAVRDKYIGSGTFIFDLDKDQSNSIDTEGTAVAGQYNPVSIGGYVEITYTDDNPLPVTLSTFNVSIANEFSELTWITQSESNNLGWKVYRSSSADFDNSTILNSALIEGAGSVTTPTEYSFIDPMEIEAGAQYWYWLESISYSGDSEIYGPVVLDVPFTEPNEETPDLPEQYGLKQNYPNPFNPSTEISFSLNYPTSVTLDIFNSKGEKISTLYDGFVEAEKLKSVTWHGEDDQGNQVSSGIYLYRLSSNGTTLSTKKMMMIK